MIGKYRSIVFNISDAFDFVKFRESIWGYPLGYLRVFLSQICCYARKFLYFMMSISFLPSFDCKGFLCASNFCFGRLDGHMTRCVITSTLKWLYFKIPSYFYLFMYLIQQASIQYSPIELWFLSATLDIFLWESQFLLSFTVFFDSLLLASSQKCPFVFAGSNFRECFFTRSLKIVCFVVQETLSM